MAEDDADDDADGEMETAVVVPAMAPASMATVGRGAGLHCAREDVARVCSTSASNEKEVIVMCEDPLQSKAGVGLLRPLTRWPHAVRAPGRPADLYTNNPRRLSLKVRLHLPNKANVISQPYLH